MLVDEAYVDFGAETALPLLARHDNLLIVRTYSKSRSMAGARLGFAIGSEALIRDLETIRFSTNPYNLDRLTLLLGETAVADDAYYMKNCKRIAQTREGAAERLKALGFMLTPSQGKLPVCKAPGRAGRGALPGAEGPRRARAPLREAAHRGLRAHHRRHAGADGNAVHRH